MFEHVAAFMHRPTISAGVLRQHGCSYSGLLSAEVRTPAMQYGIEMRLGARLLSAAGGRKTSAISHSSLVPDAVADYGHLCILGITQDIRQVHWYSDDASGVCRWFAQQMQENAHSPPVLQHSVDFTIRAR
jgi:hypothetical protein